ncbi:hypothetical protein BGW37DRAFT_528105 [Umbelopsis sp. PMI_123]|nr:hypothetical protein BGW37DRAFT_528105 [Umbelopsis sp. PMI_123]
MPCSKRHVLNSKVPSQGPVPSQEQERKQIEAPPTPTPPLTPSQGPIPSQEQERKQIEAPPTSTPPLTPKQKRKSKRKQMPDITKSLPTEEKVKKRLSKGEKKGKKNSNLLNGTVDSVKKEAKRGIDGAAKKAHAAVPDQVKDHLENTKNKVSEGKNKVEQSTKDQGKQLGIPEHFLSSDLMQEAGFDDNDAQKLMKAIMEYNKKDMMQQSSGSEGEKDDADNTQPQGELPNQQTLQPNGAQTPQIEQPTAPQNEVFPQQTTESNNHSLSDAIMNNIKVEPKDAAAAGDLTKNLVGKSVNETGGILDDTGKLIGKVTGDIKDVAGKIVNEQGNVVDEEGKVLGKAQPIDPSEVAGVKVSQVDDGQSGEICLRNGNSDLIIKVDATKTGISFSIHIPREQ